MPVKKKINLKNARKGNKLKRPASVDKMIDEGTAAKSKAGKKAVTASKKKQAAPKGKGKAAPKAAKATDSGARIPKCCYRNERVFDAGLRHTRNDHVNTDLRPSSKASQDIKAGQIVEGQHGYRVARCGVEGITGDVVKFTPNCKVRVDDKEVSAMEKTNPKGQQAGFAVAKVGGKVQNVTFRGAVWLAERGLEDEACEYIGEK